ncbi:MAG: hypothetical protein CL823_06235 [Crocinitomicaceae bacterium]|nr:hypothetical protein [Crocinitomicaceae bacterium]|tara:strand:- start:1399 stop:1632 length:234 start_codon:yes stop_codon:yes gene_type:complete
MSDLSIKRMMIFLTSACILVTDVIFFGAATVICEEINQVQESPNTFCDTHEDIHQMDMEKMNRIITLREEMEEATKR